jgi:hypothetical protein
MITYWEVVHDTITEGAPPSGETLIEVMNDEIRGESVENRIKRGFEECYAFRGDPNGFHLIPVLDHPRNKTRGDLRPIYLSQFRVEEDKKVPGLFAVSMQWSVPENIEGGVGLERVPPRRGQWSEERQSLFDPNTNRLHTTAAGEMIRNLRDTVYFPTLAYTYRMRSLPSWFKEAQRNPINEDFVRLDGESFEPYTLMVTTATADSLIDQQNESYWRDISIEIAYDPDGWDKLLPHLGYYELRMTAREYKRKAEQAAPGLNIGYELGDREIDIYPYIKNQSDVEQYIVAAREGRTITLAGVNVKIFTAMQPVTTIINPSGAMEAKDVDEPVPLDKFGVAYRQWAPGYGAYVTGQASKAYPLYLRTELTPSEILIQKKRTRKLARFSNWGLW